MRHPEFPLVSFLSIPFVMSSLPSHIRAGSVPAISLIAWLTVLSLIRGVNSIVWAGNFDIKIPIWCDITTKIIIGFMFAVPASALCILRHLESVASGRNIGTSYTQKRRRQIFEVFMCFGVPMLFMALHYIVQGHRFDLFEDLGCAPTVYFSVAAIVMIWSPPLLMSLISFVYAAMVLRHFLRHRIEFSTHLKNAQSAMTPSRYFRLMTMAIVEMVWDTGINAYILYSNTIVGVRPWISWADVHSNFSRIQVFPMFLIPSSAMPQLLFQWWILPVSCIIFFLFFGFGQEALSDYRAAAVWFRRVILRRKPEEKRPRPVLPVYCASAYDSKPWDRISLKLSETPSFYPQRPLSATVDSPPSPSMEKRSLSFTGSIYLQAWTPTLTPSSPMTDAPSLNTIVTEDLPTHDQPISSCIALSMNEAPSVLADTVVPPVATSSTSTHFKPPSVVALD